MRSPGGLLGSLGLVPDAVEPLRLRAWAWELLWSGFDAGEAAVRNPPPDASERSWQTFLRGERCARALARSLEGGSSDLLSGPGRKALKENATRETQRMLSVRGQLQDIARIAAIRELDAIVLKGGVSVVRDEESVDLVDLDLLVRPREAETFLRLLKEKGYQSAGTPPVEQHLEPLGLPDLVPVEIHTSLKLVQARELAAMWERAVPLEESPELSRLAPPDHLWYMLLHTGLQHPHRRGCLRDLTLLGSAVGECTDEEIAIVSRRTREHPEAALLEPLLETARGIHGADRAGEIPSDPFQEVAAANYIFVGRILPAGMPRTWAFPLASLVFDHLGHSARPGPWATAKADAPSPRTWITTLKSRAPRLARGLAKQLRLGRLALLEPLARWVAASARSAVRRAAESRD